MIFPCIVFSESAPSKTVAEENILEISDSHCEINDSILIKDKSQYSIIYHHFPNLPIFLPQPCPRSKRS